MSAVGVRSLDMSAAVMVMVMLRMSMRMSMKMRIEMRMRVRMRVAYASGFNIPCVDVAVAEFLMGSFFCIACKMVYRICFPAYVG